MGKRKIEIKYIENKTNRRATYSKRKKGILKKANELSLLCDAQVCLIMFSDTGKLAEYISPSTTMKDINNRYEKKTNIDLSASEYKVATVDLLKSLQNELRKQELINSILRKETSQSSGQEELREFSYGELCVLEEDLNHSLASVRHHKANREDQGSHLNPLNAVPSQVTFQLQSSQPNLHDVAAGGEYSNSNSLV
ncbi:hypothetical protein MKW92_032525 [Papaver armeniacum]|nr:hypothetical protein MKW92_032525 [Papaver armeniacum]